MSLGIDIKMAMSTTFIGSLLSNFPLLRELATTTIDPASFAFHQGKYLTRLDAASFCHEFDARHLTHFRQLQILKIPGFQEFMNAGSITHLTCLTSLTLDSREISESNFEALCRHTQLKYFKLGTISTIPINSISYLCNLTTLKCGYMRFPINWTKILASLTALQHINIIRLATDSFSPQLCSTLTHLACYRSTNQSHVLHLTALQSLDINVPCDPNMYVKFGELPQLTLLSFWIENNAANGKPLLWTALTHLSLLRLLGDVDKQQIEATKQLMPSVRVES
jgi:hypothetical protein